MKAITKIIRHPGLGLIVLIYVAFIALGMPDGLMGVAWPSVRQSFSIPIDALGSMLLVSTAGYLTSSFLSGRLMALMGVGRVLAVSCALTGIALLGYTLVPSWWMMVSLGFLAGLGAGAIDAGLNMYVAAHFGEGLMQWLHASYGIGITTGPLIMTFAVNTFQSWRSGYLTVSAFQLLLAATFTITLPLWKRNDHSAEAEKPKRLTDYQTPLGLTLLQPRVGLSLVLFFLYTGSEVALGTWSYTLLTESRGVPPELAGLFVGSYWALFTVGRVMAGMYVRRIGVSRLVTSGLLIALLGSCLLWWNPIPLSNLAAIGVVGFAIAPIFPGLVSGTSHRVGMHYAANTIGMQMTAASLGAALVPSLIGTLAHRISLEVIPSSLVAIYIILLILFWLGEYHLPFRDGTH